GGAPVRLAVLAGQRVYGLAPDLRVLVIEGTGQRRHRLRGEVNPVEQLGAGPAHPPAFMPEPFDSRGAALRLRQPREVVAARRREAGVRELAQEAARAAADDPIACFPLSDQHG